MAVQDGVEGWQNRKKLHVRVAVAMEAPVEAAKRLHREVAMDMSMVLGAALNFLVYFTCENNYFWDAKYKKLPSYISSAVF